MTAQHTPGPWHFDGGYLTAGGPEHPEIITVVDEYFSLSEANARLLAAAPDLLAALDNLVSFMTDDHTCQDCGYEEEREDGGIETLPNGQHSRTCSIPAALAAIRKARGE